VPSAQTGFSCLTVAFVGLELAVSFAGEDWPMKDYQASLEKLRRDAAECRWICDLATDPAKRDMFDRLAQHLSTLADEVERAIKTSRDNPK
jgi:hypothetical protein